MKRAIAVVLLVAGVALGSLEPLVLEQQPPHLTRTAPPFAVRNRYLPAAVTPPLSPPQNSYIPAAVYGEPEVVDARKITALPSTSYGVPDYQVARSGQGHRINRQRFPGYPVGGYQGFQGYPQGPPQQQQYPPQPYDFDYKVNDEFGNDFGHQESNDGRVTRGSYSVLLPDGRRQIVQYEADEAGFRPTVTYERVGAPYDNRRPGRGPAPGYY